MKTPRKPPTCAEAALAMVARREHAVAEVRRKLRDKGFEAADIQYVITDLLERSYLDNARYAISRARYRVSVSKWGWGRIVQELKQVGITDDEITAAHTALLDDGLNLSAAAYTLAQRKMEKVLRTPTDPEAFYKHKQKTLAALLRKGYSYTEAKAALDDVSVKG